MIKEKLCIFHHLQIGDSIICNGLVNFYSEKYQVHLPVRKHYWKTIECLYRDNSNVILFPIENEYIDVANYCKKEKISILKLGHVKEINLKNFDRFFYKQANLDYSIRYSHFKLPENILNSDLLYDKLVDINENYCLIHCESSDENFYLNIETNLQKIYISKTTCENLLEISKLIKNATEIHCVDSSVFNLVESYDVKAKLFFHNKRYPSISPFRVSDKWKMIN